MKVEWHSTSDAIEGLEPAWRDLEASVQARTLYSRYDYIIPWYRCYAGTDFVDGGTPLVGVAREGSEVVGIAPMVSAKSTFARVSLRRADVAGYNLAAGELLVQDGATGVIEAFVDGLRDELDFELINLNGIDIQSDAFRRLTEHLDARKIRHNKLEFHGYAIADLKDGYEGYRMSFGWKFRSRNKNIAKKIQEAGEIRIDRLNSTKDRALASDIRRRMIDISENSQRVRLAGVDVERAHQPFYDEIFERFGAQDAIDVALLSINGVDASCMFGLLERRVYYHTMMAFRESMGDLSPGKYLLQEVFRYLPELGYPEVLSHGSYEYKTRWASRMVPQHTLCVFGGGIKASLAHQIGFRLVHRKDSSEESAE